MLANDPKNRDAAISALETAISRYPDNDNALHARSLLFNLRATKQELLDIEKLMLQAEQQMKVGNCSVAISSLQDAIDEYSDSEKAGDLKALLLKVEQSLRDAATSDLAKCIRKADKMPLAQRADFLRDSLQSHPNAENIDQATALIEKAEEEIERLEQERIAAENAKRFYLVLEPKNAPYGPFQFEDDSKVSLGRTTYNLSFGLEGEFYLINVATKRKLGPFLYVDEEEILLSGYKFVLQRDNFEALAERQDEYQRQVAKLAEIRSKMEEEKREQEEQAEAEATASAGVCATCKGSGRVRKHFADAYGRSLGGEESNCPECNQDAKPAEKSRVADRDFPSLKKPTFGSSSSRRVIKFGESRSIKRLGD